MPTRRNPSMIRDVQKTSAAKMELKNSKEMSQDKATVSDLTDSEQHCKSVIKNGRHMIKLIEICERKYKSTMYNLGRNYLGTHNEFRGVSGIIPNEIILIVNQLSDWFVTVKSRLSIVLRHLDILKCLTI